jgi:predicted nucleic acid-binding protein
MTYLDTSVLVPLYLHEPGSLEARRVFASLPQSELAISEWSQTEFVSAVGIRVRMKHLERGAARDIIRAFHRLAVQGLTLLKVETQDFAVANQYIEQFDLGLKAGDALHLAIAWNNGAQKLFSSDQVMLRCARQFGIEAHSLASSPA